LNLEDWVVAMGDGMVGIGIRFDAIIAIEIAPAVEAVTKTEMMMEIESGIEELGRYQMKASLCTSMRWYC
jgi:hypothetical protein